MSIPIPATSGATEDNPFLIGVVPDVIEIVQTRVCQYKARPCKECGKAPSNPAHSKKAISAGTGHKVKRELGCLHCGKAKTHSDHLGVPQSLNILGSGHQGVYIGLKTTWQKVLTEHLEKSGLPRGLRSVVAECHITFPDNQDRDEGNIKFILEKALGDALTEGEWLEKDTFFPVKHYSFGNLTGELEDGVSSIRLTLFPSL